MRRSRRLGQAHSSTARGRVFKCKVGGAIVRFNLGSGAAVAGPDEERGSHCVLAC